MKKETIQHLQQLNFFKEFCDQKMEPELFCMRKEFTHQYLKGLHILVTPENTIEVWCDEQSAENNVFRVFSCLYSEQQLQRIIDWIGK